MSREMRHILLICLLLLAPIHSAVEDTWSRDSCQNEAATECRVRSGDDVTHPRCSYPPPHLGAFKVDTGLHATTDVVARNPEVESGGSWRPRDCKSRQMVAILVPYRDRLDDLRLFLPNLHGFLKRQLIHYTIFLIEQVDEKHFNRGALLNIGFAEATKMAAYDCVILHDVDKFPEDSRNLYMCSDQPTHLISKQRYVGQDYRQHPYEDYFGGVTSISSQQFRQINGFSNIFWGWGSEDDDFLSRMRHHGLRTSRVESDVGRYQEIYHPYGFVNPRRHEVKKDGQNRFETDGLNSLHYERVSTRKEPLYTHLKVRLLHDDPYLVT